MEQNTCRTTRDYSLQFKEIQAESSESRYQEVNKRDGGD
jgi:hypothetical protein